MTTGLCSLISQTRMANPTNHQGKDGLSPRTQTRNPRGMGVAKLNEVVDLISGYPFSSNDYVTSGKYKLYTIKNVQDGYTVDKVDNYLDFLPSNMSHECQLRRGI